MTGLFLIVIVALAFLASVCVAISEVIHEKDWPRETGKYPIIFAIITVLMICVF